MRLIHWLIAAVVSAGIGLNIYTGHLTHVADTPPADAVRVLRVGEGNGSGVMIAPGLMLTAAHVAAALTDTATVGQHSGPVRVLRMDSAVDLALLEVPKEVCPCIDVAEALPEVGAHVRVVGFPLNKIVGARIETAGRVLGFKDFHTLTSAPVSFGNSGGAAFQYTGLGRWALVGIVSMIPAQCTGAGFDGGCSPYNAVSMVVSADTIRRFLFAGTNSKPPQ